MTTINMTNMTPILVTGATGKIGGAVAHEFLRRGVPVRALARSVDTRSKALQQAGAEIVIADLFDPDQVVAAMRGTSRAFFLPPHDQYMIQSAVVFAIAARQAKLEAIVELSQWLASPAHPSLLTRQHWLADQLFSMVPNIAHITINSGPFADSYLELDILRSVANLGIYPNPFGAGRDAPASTEDIARVSVEALLDPARHAGGVYRPTGPTLLTSQDMAEILGRVFERRVSIVDLKISMVKKALRASGWSPFMQANTVTYAAEAQGGNARELGAPTNHVLEVTGRQPEDFETIARRYAELPAVRRSLRNRSQALWELMKTTLTPGANLERYERMQHIPSSPTLHFDYASATWRTEHEIMASTGFSPSLPPLAGLTDVSSGPQVLGKA